MEPGSTVCRAFSYKKISVERKEMIEVVGRLTVLRVELPPAFNYRNAYTSLSFLIQHIQNCSATLLIAAVARVVTVALSAAKVGAM